MQRRLCVVGNFICRLRKINYHVQNVRATDDISLGVCTLYNLYTLYIICGSSLFDKEGLIGVPRTTFYTPNKMLYCLGKFYYLIDNLRIDHQYVYRFYFVQSHYYFDTIVIYIYYYIYSGLQKL
jgi:hypothetical protein